MHLESMSDTAIMEDRPCLRPDLTVRFIHNEAVILLPDGERACVLNPQAAAVLQLCDGTRTVAELVTELQYRFLGSTAVMSKQIQECLLQFRDLSLLQ